MNTDRDRLLQNGWIEVRGNRWTHPELPALAGRRRIFHQAAALARLDQPSRAIPKPNPMDEPTTNPTPLDHALAEWLDGL